LIELVETYISFQYLSTLPKLCILFIPGKMFPLTSIFSKDELAFTIKEPVISASFINIRLYIFLISYL
jgi:hypothetical protein